MRIILHVDMDCFFAQVEERANPAIKGIPVVVGANPKEGKGRGVVATCNYEARKYGLKSAMPISIAWTKCPRAVYLPPRFELYSEASCKVMDIFKGFADRFEQVSIDEAYLDVSSAGSYEKARLLAQEIKDRVKAAGLTCSVGIGPNKLVAKIAAGEKKPDGLTIVKNEEVNEFLNPKKVGVIYGIGPKTESALNALGIVTVEDLAKAPEEVVDELGNYGRELQRLAKGVDERDIIEQWETKSIGRQSTFDKDTKNRKQIIDLLDGFIPELYRDLDNERVMFRTVTFKVRYEDFETHTKSRTLPEFTSSIKIIRKLTTEWVDFALEDVRKIRLVGVSLHNLKRKSLNSSKQPQKTWNQ